MKQSIRDTTSERKRRPPAPGEPVTVRLQPVIAEALDASIEANRIGRSLTRPETIRGVLMDRLKLDGWLTEGDQPGPRLLLHREQKRLTGPAVTAAEDGGKFYKPSGPATKVVEEMELAIKKDRGKLKRQKA